VLVKASRFQLRHGLSYSTFRYSELKVERSAGGVLRTSARITNDSELNGDEVAQLYITSPLPELKGFQRCTFAQARAA
jgi:beta-glucosidase